MIVTREAGGTTNLNRTSYAYSYADYHRQVVRTEQTYPVAAWVNDNKVTYKYDGMERLDYEERHDWDDVGSTWVTRYDTTQEYDKNGNRTRLHKNVAAGYTASYGEEMDLSYTFSNVNALTAIADDDDALYSCAVTSDANNNITAVQETATVGAYTADLYTYFSYDWANRLGNWWVRAYDSGQKDWQLTKREHGYDAAGRLVNSTYKQWWEQGEEPSGDYLEHTYAGSKHIQNYDGSSTYAEVWHWAGAQNAHAAPVKSPNPDTASQAAFNIANDKTPQRTTWQNPTTAGDERNLYGQGKPMAKDSSGSGSDWSTGLESESPDSVAVTLNSRFDFDGTVTATDLDRATDAREKGRIGIFGSALSYAGSSGRVTSEPLGRDVNPFGRGSGAALVGGAMNLGQLFPALPASQAKSGTGDSINNCGQCGGGGCGDSFLPPKPGDPGFNPDPGFDAPMPPRRGHTPVPHWNPWIGEKSPSYRGIDWSAILSAISTASTAYVGPGTAVSPGLLAPGVSNDPGFNSILPPGMHGGYKHWHWNPWVGEKQPIEVKPGIGNSSAESASNTLSHVAVTQAYAIDNQLDDGDDAVDKPTQGGSVECCLIHHKPWTTECLWNHRCDFSVGSKKFTTYCNWEVRARGWEYLTRETGATYADCKANAMAHIPQGANKSEYKVIEKGRKYQETIYRKLKSQPSRIVRSPMIRTAIREVAWVRRTMHRM